MGGWVGCQRRQCALRVRLALFRLRVLLCCLPCSDRLPALVMELISGWDGLSETVGRHGRFEVGLVRRDACLPYRRVSRVASSAGRHAAMAGLEVPCWRDHEGMKPSCRARHHHIMQMCSGAASA